MNNSADHLNRIEIGQGDITLLKVDAIVNAANSSLLGGGGVDGAIHRAAGPELLAECKTIGGCPTGEARITAGYNLPAKFVIHTVGPIYSGTPKDPVFLASCHSSSLALAAEHGAETIAFPAISCGTYGYPVTEACEVAINTTQKFLMENSTIKKVIFMLFSDENKAIFDNHLASISKMK